jgi:hypothetical protein
MAKQHPFEGFDGLIARAAAILETEGQPKSWKVKNRAWYAQQIIVANDLMRAAIAEGDAIAAARWGVRLGKLLGEAPPPGLTPPRSAGGKALAATKTARNTDWQRQAELKAKPGMSKRAVARLMAPGDPKKEQSIRKAIKKSW